jgi:membrane-associated phospholipid phosphatase
VGGGVLQTIYVLINLIFNPSKIDTFILVINFSVELFVMTIFKVWHHQPRPFWQYSEIRADACYTQFGNPSGHSSFASFFAMYLFYKYFVKIENRNENDNSISILKSPSSEYSTLTKIIAFSVLTVGYLAIGFSRFILGVHSAN